MSGGVEHVSLDVEDKMPLLARLARPPYSDEWNMVMVPWGRLNREVHARRWLLTNLSGRFGLHKTKNSLMIFFESPSDFMKFNLIDGPTEFQNMM